MNRFNNGARGQRLPDYLPWEDVQRVVCKARIEYRVKDYFMVGALAWTGMCVSEVANLRLENISSLEGKIKIVAGKGDKDRYVIAPEFFINDLIYYAEKKNITSGLLFPIGTRSIQYRIGDMSLDAIDEGVNCHKFRHSFAVNWLKKAGNLRSLQIQLGHSDLSTTAVYLKLSMQDVKEDFDRVFGMGG